MKPLLTLILFTALTVCSGTLSTASAADYSGIWFTKSSRSQTVVKKSGNRYYFEKTSFHRGKIARFRGYMTERGKSMIIKYDSGVSASARIMNPELIIESSTVKWEKVSGSTRLPSFNLTGTWKGSLSMTLRQSGSRLSGTDSRGNRLTGQIYGHVLYLDSISKTGVKMTYSYLAVSSTRLMASSFYSKPSYIVKQGSGADDLVSKEREPAAADIRTPFYGLWKSSNPIVKIKIAKSNFKNRIKADGTIRIKNKKASFTGMGTVTGNRVVIKFRFTGPRPAGWGGYGDMRLNSSGTKMLRGTWMVRYAGKGPITLRK